MPEDSKPTAQRQQVKKRPQRRKSSTEKIFGSKVLIHGYTGVPNLLVRGQARLGISTTQFNIIVQLLSYWFDPKRPPYPTKRELAQRISITPKTVQTNIAALEKAGLIEREQQISAFGDYSSNIYRLDGLVAKLKTMEPEFTAERKKRALLRKLTETPKGRRRPEA